MIRFTMNELETPKLEKREKLHAGGWKSAILVKFLVFLCVFCGLFALLYKTGWIDVFFSKDDARAFLESLGPLKFIGFILLQAAQVVLAPIPGEVTGIIGGYFFGLVWGVILSTVGLTLGSFIAFILSRIFGRPLVEKFVDPAVLGRFDYLLERKGIFLVFVLFLLPGVPKDYLCFILGLGQLTAIEFLAVSTLGRLFGTVLLTLSGGFIRYHQYGKLGVLVAAAAAVFLLVFFLRSRIEDLLRSLHPNKS